MGGLAFSTLTLLCLLIPGFAYQFIYYRRTAQGDTAAKVDPGSARPLVLAILISLPMHSVWVGAIALIDSFVFPIGRVDFATLLPILQGEPVENIIALASNLSGIYLAKLAVYITSQTAAAMYCGTLVAAWMHNNGWTKLRMLSSEGALWHKRLEFADDEPDGIIISVTLTLGDTTYLYYGLLEEYQLTETGELKNIVLRAAARRNMSVPGEDAYELPGEYFVLNCRKVETVDIDYFWLAPVADDEEDPDDNAVIDVEIVDD